MVRSVTQADIQTTDGIFPWKIETRFPRDVKELRKFFSHTYQADVLFTDKCRFDLGIKDYIRIPDREKIEVNEIEIPEEALDIQPNYVILDAELDERLGFPSKDNPVAPYLCLTLYSYLKDRYYVIYQADSMDAEKVRGHLEKYLEQNPGMHDILKGEMEKILSGVEKMKFIPREDEIHLLQTIPAILHKLETDFIGGWNVWRFDMPVTEARMEHMGVNPRAMSEIGRLNGQGGRRPIVGIPIFDTSDGWQKLLRSKPESWKLEYVGQKELKAGKMMKFPNGIGHEWANGDREAVLAYNIIDVVLVKAINDKLNILAYNLGVAQTAGADIEEVFYSSKLIDNYVFHKLHGKMILPSQIRAERREKFKGAIVFTPPAGVHHNVIVLDLKALYPNIIISCKIDPTTIINDGEQIPEDYILCPNGQMFRKDKPGIIPGILQEMIDYRGKFKRMMKDYPKGSDEYRKYDAMQFSYKTLTNAVYGVLGFGGFRLMDVRCGETVTAVGRAIITFSAEKAREHGYEVIYTDSVTGDTPLLIRREGFIDTVAIEDFFSPTDTRKRAILPDDIEVYAKGGWTKLQYAYRHKRREDPGEKNIFGLNTYEGFVNVTDGHSVFLEDGSCIRGDEVKEDSLLMKEDVPKLLEVDTIGEDLAWALGFFAAEGSCGDYRESCGKLSWNISCQNEDLLMKAGRAFSAFFGIQFKILDVTESSQCKRLVPYSAHQKGNTKSLVAFFRKFCYTRYDWKKVPACVLNSSNITKQAFLDGYLAGDGNIDYQGNRRWSSISHPLIFGVWLLLKELGSNIRVETREDMPNTINIIEYKGKGNREKEGKSIYPRNLIRSIRKHEINEPVYDVGTENHTFCGGIGLTVLHNTDSIFVKGPQDATLSQLIDLGYDLAAYLNDTYDHFASQLRISPGEHTFKIEFEKIYRRLFFTIKESGEGTKKKYAGRIVYAA
jgi:DNA polymerase elongation subunit (family B)